MGMKLFDDVGNDEDVEKIEINQEFAKRYEHNKKREDMQKYEVMKKKGEIGSSSESESESEPDVDLDNKKLKEFLSGLQLIKDKDPILKQKDAKLFESSDEEDEDEDDREIAKESKPKPMFLKDLNPITVIEEGAEFNDEEDDDEDENVERKMKSFVEEQEDLRREVLAGIAAEEKGGESGGEGDLLIEKVRDDGEKDEGGNAEIKQKLDEFFGEDEKLNENDMFLKEFFKNKLWIDKGKGNVGESNEDFGLSEDEDLIEKQEEYERDYNFRFEESKTDRVLGHSRIVEGSVRKETNARKQQRDRKKERMELAELARREEVKRLKNLKRREIQEKLDKIREIAGVDEEGIPLNEDDLEKDFDPDEFDLKMKKAFGDGYYDAEDVDPEFGNVGGDGAEDGSDLEKPDFDKEDELLGLPKNWDVIKSKDGFLAKRGEKKNGKEVIVEEEEEEEEEEEDEGKVAEGKRKKKRKSKLGEALMKELEEELYKYDYEDAIGDLKTRFKYRKVKPDRYKLSAAEILWLDEQELNQYVSLKKLATYRETEWKVPKMRKNMLLQGALNLQKEKKRKMDGEGPSDMAYNGKSEKKKRKIEGEGPSNMDNSGKAEEGEGDKEETKMSRNARRRKNKKDKSLPSSRLSAYGATSGSKKSKS